MLALTNLNDRWDKFQLKLAQIRLHQVRVTLKKNELLHWFKLKKSIVMLKWMPHKITLFKLNNFLQLDNSLDLKTLVWLVRQELPCNTLKSCRTTLQTPFCLRRVCTKINWNSSTRIHLPSTMYGLKMIPLKLFYSLFQNILGDQSLVLTKQGMWCVENAKLKHLLKS